VSTLDNLKKEAKRWLKAVRALDAQAIARLRRTYPDAPSAPALRDVQHALAREHGFENWLALRSAVPAGAGPDDAAALATGGRTHDERVATFLQFACWDHHVHGVTDHRMYGHAARRLLDQHPEIAHDSIYTAVVAGDLDEVERRLAERPEAAREPGGARGWPPILYLSFTRFPHQPAIDNAVAVARTLLDRGADPNAFYMAGSSSYTALVGVAAGGEQSSPRQPQSAALFQLLLERGAEPFDIQVLYNTHFNCDLIWWLDLVHAFTTSHGRADAWEDPDWTMLDMGGYGPGAFFILNAAINRNALDVAEWTLAHGASPHLPRSAHPKFKPRRTLYERATLHGLTEMAALLARHGGGVGDVPLDDEEVFLAACFRADRAAAQWHLEKHPEYLQSPTALFAAAERNRDDVVALLLDLGVPIEIEDGQKQRALHMAAADDRLRAAQLLIDRGAEVDPRESHHRATPLGYAVHYAQERAIAFLSRLSRDVWQLTFTGNADRLREVLQASPDLAKSIAADGMTLLWWLPDDEDRALAVVEVLLAHGADPTVRLANGQTAAQWARKAGLPKVARLLGVGLEDEAVQAPKPPDLDMYERLAQDLVFAFETGHADAMQRLQQHFSLTFTWEALRAGVRQLLAQVPEGERPEGYFAIPHARLLVAKRSGFRDWNALERSLAGDATAAPSIETAPQRPPADPTARMIQPIELRGDRTVRLHDGVRTTTGEVWSMLTASREGDLDRVKALVASCPSLVRCDHNYMPPLHLAVREGHVELVRCLASQGAVNPRHVTYPYNETLAIVAEDRGFVEIARLLEEHARLADPQRGDDESGTVEIVDDELQRFEALVGANALAAVAAMLDRSPALVRNELASLGEGILSGPANRRSRPMLELLIARGARVPDISKWAHAYYFKHDDIAAYLMDQGMNPNHMDCHHTTLLHQMAWKGDLVKARLLLDHGAALDPVDEEFRSTPLGLAARWGRAEMVALLLERGADPNAAGAPWAAPLEWARKKGHSRIEAQLRLAGAA
jgi:ankyrin repeat protein